MPKIVFDIETVGQDFDLLDEASKEYFLKFAETEEKIEEAKASLNFYPLTAQVVAIGMLEVESEQGIVYFQNGSPQKEKFVEGSITYISGSEKEILNHFWTQLNRYEQFVTFNGRVFDCPFVMIRSAIQKIRAVKNLVPYRYDYKQHVDLADQLSFYDALRRKFGLHMWCQAFGIQSPKQEGITGLQVKDFFQQGKYHDIARYCMRDIIATKELYLYWEKYIRF
ncbi:MAG: hypothetical protein A2787_07200 [Omnitrophica WOR_2 bacterium RIFCSPHIGHO2_01_FULL_48_9]|nr:MAG: hypothetical protein A3D10_00190 [Omnitrophica WOR_2 bacterium RIFCSPHIGHO2_02_FULL_48_11]OGX32911.1 MAG: hypothetical protein A2787_07200 [Omnitrophica WOR_2 bacterium RIFCSPHIGHO2_01_FULL_48_9]